MFNTEMFVVQQHSFCGASWFISQFIFYRLSQKQGKWWSVWFFQLFSEGLSHQRHWCPSRELEASAERLPTKIFDNLTKIKSNLGYAK